MTELPVPLANRGSDRISNILRLDGSLRPYLGTTSTLPSPGDREDDKILKHLELSIKVRGNEVSTVN